jgi:5-formyltetrahydrofolate cyclo-ligase
MPNEVNIIKVLNKVRKTNKILLPFMVGKSFKVVPYRLPLYPNKFGIFEAKNSIKKINNINIAIVPVVGVDQNLQRVGFGKGMYDRFFSKLTNRPYTIFIQLEPCYTNKKVCDDFDVKCDLLLTSKTIKIAR